MSDFIMRETFEDNTKLGTLMQDLHRVNPDDVKNEYLREALT